MKRLLITSDCFLPRWDGIARFLAEVIPGLSKEFKVTVAVPRFHGRLERVKGVKYVRFEVRPTRFGDIQFTRFNYRHIRELVKQNDVVFNQTIGPLGMSAIMAARSTRTPIVHYVHSIDWELASKGVKRFERVVYTAVKRLARYFHNRCSVLLLPSKAIENIIVQNGVRSKRRVVPMGVDTRVFAPARDKGAAKKAIGLDPESFIVGFVGRVAREKDLPTLVSAFREFRSVWKGDARLLIVGGGLLGEIPDAPDIVKVGPKGDVQKYLRAMDVFVLPSFTETSSLATMEAMACGLPVVCTPVGNIPEYIQDQENGLLFARGDVQGLAEHLSVLAMDGAQRVRLGAAARRTIQKRFSKPRMIHEIAEAIETALIRP